MTAKRRPPRKTPRQHVSVWLKLLRNTEARLLLGMGGAGLALWAFLAIADEVREGGTMKVDRALLLAFRRAGDLATPIGPRWIQESARDFTALGGFTTLLLISAMAFTILMLLRRRTQAYIFGVTVVVAQVAAELIKHLVDRPRPDLVPQHDLIYSASFPSGHSMMAPVVYLTLAAIVAAGHRRRAIKTLLLAGAAGLVLVVGVSRVYLGVHWPSDVLAGWTLGAAIALIADVALFRTAPRRGAAAEIKADTPGPSGHAVKPQAVKP